MRFLPVKSYRAGYPGFLPLHAVSTTHTAPRIPHCGVCSGEEKSVAPANFMSFLQQTCYEEDNCFYQDSPMTRMKRIFINPIDLTKVNTLIYHLPDGPTLSVEMDGFGGFLDLDTELGDVCDTSDIDGVLHFFPRGNA